MILKKVVEISEVQGIAPVKDNFVVFTTSKKSGLYEKILFISVKSNCIYKSFGSNLIYQTNTSGDIFLITEDLKTIKFEGDYSSLGAFGFKNGFVVANKKSKTYHYISSESSYSKELGFYFKKSGNIEEEYLFKRLGEDLTLFSISEKDVKYSINVPMKYNINASLCTDIFGFDNKIYLPLSDGQLLALDIATGELRWKQESIGNTAIFKDRIYCVSVRTLQEFELKVLDSSSGEVIHNKLITDLDKDYGFRPTGKLKVYTKYIFLMSSRKPGLIAVFERDTLYFREMINIEESIPVGIDNLHWHNNKLFVLDTSGVLHVFEE